MPVIILTLFWQSCWVVAVNAADADVLWTRAVTMAQQGQMDLAFTNFRMIVDDYPDSAKTPKAQLDVGEYYYSQNDFNSALPEFENIVRQHPKDKESLIALAYLFKMAQLQGQKEAMGKYQKQLASSHPFALVFNNSKSLECTSGFLHKYKMVFQIDRIEVFKDGRSFVEIPS